MRFIGGYTPDFICREMNWLVSSKLSSFVSCWKIFWTSSIGTVRFSSFNRAEIGRPVKTQVAELPKKSFGNGGFRRWRILVTKKPLLSVEARSVSGVNRVRTMHLHNNTAMDWKAVGRFDNSPCREALSSSSLWADIQKFFATRIVLFMLASGFIPAEAFLNATSNLCRPSVTPSMLSWQSRDLSWIASGFSPGLISADNPPRALCNQCRIRPAKPLASVIWWATWTKRTNPPSMKVRWMTQFREIFGDLVRSTSTLKSVRLIASTANLPLRCKLSNLISGLCATLKWIADDSFTAIWGSPPSPGRTTWPSNWG